MSDDEVWLGADDNASTWSGANGVKVQAYDRYKSGGRKIVQTSTQSSSRQVTSTNNSAVQFSSSSRVESHGVSGGSFVASSLEEARRLAQQQAQAQADARAAALRQQYEQSNAEAEFDARHRPPATAKSDRLVVHGDDTEGPATNEPPPGAVRVQFAHQASAAPVGVAQAGGQRGVRFSASTAGLSPPTHSRLYDVSALRVGDDATTLPPVGGAVAGAAPKGAGKGKGVGSKKWRGFKHQHFYGSTYTGQLSPRTTFTQQAYFDERKGKERRREERAAEFLQGVKVRHQMSPRVNTTTYGFGVEGQGQGISSPRYSPRYSPRRSPRRSPRAGRSPRPSYGQSNLRRAARASAARRSPRAARSPRHRGHSQSWGMKLHDLGGGRVSVAAVQATGPAARNGLRSDDQILAVNGVPARGVSNVASQLSRNVVTISFLRDGRELEMEMRK